MVLRTWRIYARLNEDGEPTEFSCVSCLLHQTSTFVLWKLCRGTREEAQREVTRQTNLFIKKVV